MGDYQLENLSPERFQELCQALLLKEFKGLQSYPVGQPDGGRDAIAPLFNTDGDFIVFQVKFVRNPQGIDDPHQWLTSVVKDEAPKLAKLIPQGASRYVLLTNVLGTAHLQTGSMDKVDSLLASEFSIPAQCWWRGDIVRRLDGAFDVKWVYPEVMGGQDALRMIIESGLTEDRTRRSSAIKAFVVSQFQQDNEVRFKQVELENRLLDLFVDVPAVLRSPAASRSERAHEGLLFRTIASENDQASPHWGGRWASDLDERFLRHADNIQTGAGALILNRQVQQAFPLILLEGAPGQGKSTLTQFVCQVHRMHFLSKDDQLEKFDASYSGQPARLPVRIELRDYAAWINQRNPFGSEEHDSDKPSDWNPSLESFVARLIGHRSGGAAFSVSDLHAVIRASSLLLVLDGLDEVARMDDRRTLIQEVESSVDRLEQLAASLQVVVTTRPAAFAASPGFSERFKVFNLESLTGELIREYSEKWMEARGIDERDRGGVRNLLANRLSEPHLRDLARNPMQLAILLSLVHTRGASLPNKRTELYDHYVDLFFSREAEKSQVVREFRDLLISLHRHLGFLLHVESEEGTGGGISQDRLLSVLEDYLAEHGHPRGAVEDLFRGLVERVVALVSRVEGTFEFEVQPLREYFAARYLFETAPYAPVGREVAGTLPERFAAISRNPFWLNVTRFFAGCYSVGQVPSLVDGLQDLFEDPLFKEASHPRVLSALLLSDWTLNQVPRSKRIVIDLCLKDLGRRHAMGSGGLIRTQDQLVLPPKNGREQVEERAWDLLRRGVSRLDYAHITSMLGEHSSNRQLFERWRSFLSTFEGAREVWFRYGRLLGALSNLTSQDIEELDTVSPLTPEEIGELFEAGRTDLIELHASWVQSIVDGILNGTTAAAWFIDRVPEHPLLRFASAILGARYSLSLLGHSMLAPPNKLPPVQASGELTSLQMQAQEVALQLEEELAKGRKSWLTDPAVWIRATELVGTIDRSAWAAHEVAIVGAGIVHVSTQDDSAYSEILDESVGLFQRAAYARRRAGHQSYWRRLLEQMPESMTKRLFVLGLATAWSGPTTLPHVWSKVESVIQDLSTDDFNRLLEVVGNAGRQRRSSGTFEVQLHKWSAISERGIVLLHSRVGMKNVSKAAISIMKNYEGVDPAVLGFRAHLERGRVDRRKSATWSRYLRAIARAYKEDVDVSFPFTVGRSSMLANMPLKTARRIVVDCESYPLELVVAAEARCSDESARGVDRVGTLALRQNWYQKSSEAEQA